MTSKAIGLIAAMSRNRVIGKNNRLPWHLPADLQHFKHLTMGKPMIMGRKTWESLPGLLPGRPHIVLSRNPAYRAPGASVAASLDDALVLAQHFPATEVMIIGGASLYAQALPKAARMYLTLVDVDSEGDAYFPRYNLDDWQLVAHTRRCADAKNPYNLDFLTLERVQ